MKPCNPYLHEHVRVLAEQYGVWELSLVYAGLPEDYIDECTHHKFTTYAVEDPYIILYIILKPDQSLREVMLRTRPNTQSDYLHTPITERVDLVKALATAGYTPALVALRKDKIDSILS